MFGPRRPFPLKANAYGGGALESDCLTRMVAACYFDWLRYPWLKLLGTSDCNSFDGRVVGIATIQAGAECSSVFDDGDAVAISGDEKWESVLVAAWKGGGTGATEPCC